MVPAPVPVMVTPQLPPEREQVLPENETVPVPDPDQLTVSPFADEETVAVQVAVPPTSIDVEVQDTAVLVGARPEEPPVTVMDAVFDSGSMPGYVTVMVTLPAVLPVTVTEHESTIRPTIMHDSDEKETDPEPDSEKVMVAAVPRHSPQPATPVQVMEFPTTMLEPQLMVTKVVPPPPQFVLHGGG